MIANLILSKTFFLKAKQILLTNRFTTPDYFSTDIRD